MTLLQSVTSVYQKLRDQGPTTLSTGLSDQTIVGFLNEAAAEVLNTHAWTFLQRTDGVVFFPSRFTATAGMSIAANASVGSLNSGGNAWANGDVSDFTARGQNGRLGVRFRPSGATRFGQTSLKVSDLSVLPNFPFTLREPYRGDTITGGAFELYAHEIALPDTVRQVLSVQHQETPLQLHFVDRSYTLNAVSPRMTDVFVDQPTDVYVGGLVLGVSQDATVTATAGLGLMIWPPPISELTIHYDYIYRFADLANDADTWTGVPSEVVKQIEWVAFEKALDSNVEDDPVRGARIRVKLEASLQRLKDVDGRMLHKRYVTRELGSRARGRVVNARWQNQEIVP